MTDEWTDRVSVGHGVARASYGPQPYGGDRIIANAPLTRQGFDDLTKVVDELKQLWTRGTAGE